MGPEFGLGVGKDSGARKPFRPRPSLAVRGVELAGLALLIYGLGSYRFLAAGLGAAMIVASYALYRRKHGPMPPDGPDNEGAWQDMDGGGD